ncbi:efflux transporter periplasmic adaptor subunit [Kosakonia radicincitans DSM 16656]|uniref:Membrane fusion protein, multidrug efflux system n=1 Tax=Kosakonia radicincitans TaxID=283686 RepID=A0AAX2EQD9_9ENTR|nr:efflux RND transporter periplasmic adaptor subunit [Kosakonia radicincitans]MDP9565938.1 membrane fusion protein (multidrug efflux system) [Kosakonia oryzae]APG19521.1 efflux transporter periplasmic adaptor subunit [Kosakonia radicincitans]ARD59346.1 efflux transporter periplasmic adaptor subunit [Kosakonia radicincitans DSM 16656]KDE35722.1 acriflavine resistance protein E [Kosakonia radicincitans UMEnt01/12]MDD7995439.1 efflux RND transporter periplasmic adaptor subunit [Kosakonia radicin
MALKRIMVAVLACLIVACDQKPETNAGAMAMQVGVVTLKAEPVTLFSDLTGRVTGTMVSDVRPQVEGIIKKRLFKEGDDVVAGQVLYEIDPATYQASYDEAVAQLQNAVAIVNSSKLKAERYAALVKENGVSRQDADDAMATYKQNVASVAQYRAAVESAKINLGYTKVRAPISGRIGISSVTPGALVTASQTTALATIRTLDPIYVDLTQSSTQLLKLKKQQLQNSDNTVPVTVTLDDGSQYQHPGKLELTEVSVDESTGSVTLRAVFPNPEHDLLPGMFVRATVSNGVRSEAILAPQQGITRDAKGNGTALVVNKENKVESREVVTDRVIGNKWLITQGLQSGDRLITEGTSKVQAGMTVKAVEVGATESSDGNGGK